MRRFVQAAVTAAVVGLGLAVPAATGAAGGDAGGTVSDSTAAPSVLLVGSYDGIRGGYSSIQAAVDAAKKGDYILVGPGDYKTTSIKSPVGGPPAGVLITTPDLHLRGMDRNTVVVDGTKPGSPQCSAATGDQNFGPSDGGSPEGLNGVMVWKADNVWVQNMTVCNFLGGSGGDGGTGNEVWWNGGANSGVVGGWGYIGSYLTATSTYYGGESTAAQYGIFSSNWSGGTWDQTYASNFNDSGYYIGACQDVCDQVINKAWAEYNALGYSGSNSGGNLVVANSVFDNNEDGFDTNSQNGDNPPPQNGGCPGNGISPVTHTHSCWVFLDNLVADNNNPNVPAAGSAAAGPVGTGMSLSGGRNDTVMDNVFMDNGAWGNIIVPYPDSGAPCSGGVLTPALCLFDESGDAVIGNTYEHNGFFGNPTNGDIAAVNLLPGATDCFGGNKKVGGGAPTTSPPLLQSLYPNCTGATVPPDLNALFLDEVACDSESIDIGPVSGDEVCLPGTKYPRETQVIMHPLPTGLASMADPCQGVPANPWCPGNPPASSAEYATSGSVSATLTSSAAYSSVLRRDGLVRRNAAMHSRRPAS